MGGVGLLMARGEGSGAPSQELRGGDLRFGRAVDGGEWLVVVEVPQVIEVLGVGFAGDIAGQIRDLQPHPAFAGGAHVREDVLVLQSLFELLKMADHPAVEVGG